MFLFAAILQAEGNIIRLVSLLYPSVPSTYAEYLEFVSEQKNIDFNNDVWVAPEESEFYHNMVRNTRLMETIEIRVGKKMDDLLS